MDEHRAFAVPARAGERGVIALQHRTCVHVVALPAAPGREPCVEVREFLFKNQMVILAPGVMGDPAVPGAPGRLAVPVIDRQHNHGARAGQHLLGIRAPGFVALEPGHVAVASLLEPLKKLGGVRRGDTGRYSAQVKPQRVRLLDQLGFQGVLGHENTWLA
jgi:hypothetical protein